MLKNKKSFLQRIVKAYLAESQENYMNTMTVATGQTIDVGKAQQLTHHNRKVYSQEIAFKALPIMKFAQFAKMKTELSKTPGTSISMMCYKNLKKGGKLKEGTRMTTQGLDSTMKEISITEYGNAVSVSELALKTSFTNVMQDATILLARDYAETVDTELRDVALTAPNVVYAREGGEEQPTKRDDLTKGLTVASVKDAVEILATNNTPKFEGSYYVCFIHPHQSRVLRDDKNWLDASKYAQPNSLFNGEIGRLEDVRFIETTQMCNGACVKDHPAFKDIKNSAGKPVYQSVLFGEDFYAIATGLPVELRDSGVVDFGREHALAWYSITGFDKLNADRGVVIETL